tara:strand:+ start:357 stop:722 length:366 start_codon:yes stop_codon:yes gene_type:complete
MWKSLKDLLLVNWLRVNATNITKILIYIILTFAISYLYRRWEVLLIVRNPDALLWLLIFYTIFLFVIFIKIFLLSRDFVFLRVPDRAISAKKSLVNKSNAFKEIGDVRLRPKLYKKDGKQL